jgi:elongation factor P
MMACGLAASINQGSTAPPSANVASSAVLFRFDFMLAKDIKNGTVVNYHDAPCMIETTSVQSPSARGAATIYKFRARNLVTKAKIDIVLRSGESLNEANFEKRPIKFMYADASHMHFLDQQDFNQYSLTLAEVANEAQFLTDNLEGVQALIYNDECVGLQLPVVVELKVTQCDPGVKGNSATGRTKPATLETGLVVHVPEYMAQGDVVKVDTRSGEYLSRV